MINPSSLIIEMSVTQNRCPLSTMPKLEFKMAIMASDWSSQFSDGFWNYSDSLTCMVFFVFQFIIFIQTIQYKYVFKKRKRSITSQTKLMGYHNNAYSGNI
jgi:hypothetical protein